MINTTWNGNEELDVSDLIKLKKAIDNLIDLEDNNGDELALQDTRVQIKSLIKGIAIDLNINGEFIMSYLEYHNRYRSLSEIKNVS
ncbi:MAG: hypothetical protein ACKPJO_08405 [Dolichospermum sp.]